MHQIFISGKYALAKKKKECIFPLVFIQLYAPIPSDCPSRLISANFTAQVVIKVCHKNPKGN